MICILVCPENFSAEARREFERIIKLYTDRKEISKLEPMQAMLELYCEAVGTYKKAMSEVKKTSEVIAQKGKPIENPWLGVAKKAADDISKYVGLFDLSADIKAVDVRINNGAVEYRTSRITKMLGVTQQAMSKWTKEGCPTNKHGWWDIEKVLAWRGLVGSGVKNAKQIEDRTLAEQKMFFEVKLKQSQGEALSLKTRIQNGEFLEREVVVQELGRTFEILKRTLNAAVNEISLEVGGHVDLLSARKIEDYLKDIVRDYLTQMSERMDYEPVKQKRKKRK